MTVEVVMSVPRRWWMGFMGAACVAWFIAWIMGDVELMKYMFMTILVCLIGAEVADVKESVSRLSHKAETDVDEE